MIEKSKCNTNAYVTALKLVGFDACGVKRYTMKQERGQPLKLSNTDAVWYGFEI